MSVSRRELAGHALMRLGVGLRVVAACVTGALLVALVAGVVVIPLARHGAYPEPFSYLGHATRSGDLGQWLWQGALFVVAALLGGRAVALALGGLGWLLLPKAHRQLLARLTRLPPPGGVPAEASTLPQAGQLALSSASRTPADGVQDSYHQPAH